MALLLAVLLRQWRECRRIKLLHVPPRPRKLVVAAAAAATVAVAVAVVVVVVRVVLHTSNAYAAPTV